MPRDAGPLRAIAAGVACGLAAAEDRGRWSGRARPGPRRAVLGDRPRALIEGPGWTAYALGPQAGVAAGVIPRFLNGERGLTLASLEKLAAVLNVHLVEVGARRSPGRRLPRKPARKPGPGPAPGPDPATN